jgi:hypothetical protein
VLVAAPGTLVDPQLTDVMVKLPPDATTAVLDSLEELQLTDRDLEQLFLAHYRSHSGTRAGGS